MKRFTAWILSLIFVLSLAACGVKPADNTQTQNFADPTPVTFEADPDYYYGNRQKNTRRTFLKLDDEILFNFDPGKRTYLYAYHLETGEVRRFCPDPDCDHKRCPGVPYYNLEVYDGKLYGTIGYEPDRLKVVDGTQTEYITEEKASFSIHVGSKIYMRTEKDALAVLEEGQEKAQVILENFSPDGGAIFGPYLYTMIAEYTDFNIVRVDLTAETPVQETLVANSLGMADGQHIYYVNMETYQLYRCNMDGSNPQLLLEQQVMPISINFDNEYFYYRLLTEPTNLGADAYDIYRFPKSDPSKIEKIVTLEAPVHSIFTAPGTGKLFVTICGTSYTRDADIYVMGTDGSNPTRLEIPE